MYPLALHFEGKGLLTLEILLSSRVHVSYNETSLQCVVLVINENETHHFKKVLLMLNIIKAFINNMDTFL